MLNHGITKNKNCNNDNMMRVIELFGGLLWCQNPWYMGGKRDLYWEYLFPRVSYIRESEVETTPEETCMNGNELDE